MKRLLIGLLSVLLLSCAKVNTDNETDTSLVGPTPVNPITSVKVIEYRVNGSVSAAAIRYVSPTEGTVLVNTTLPWVGQSKTNQDTFFVYLAAQDVGTGLVALDLQVQVFIDGKLFRETIVNGFLPQAVVSGTYTK